MMNRTCTATLLALALALSTTAALAGETGYDKGFFIRDGGDGDTSYELKIGARIQTRFTVEAPDGGDAAYNVSIPRARLTLKGHMLTKALTHKLQVDFGKGDVQLKDFYVNYAFMDAVQLRLGQFKRPFSRQQLTSSSKLELVDRSITDKGFGAGRDLGVEIHNAYDKSPQFEWSVGIFNGTGDKGRFTGTVDMGDVAISRTNVPDTMEPAVVARIGYNTPNMKGEGYSEADFNPERGVRLGVAGGVLVDLGAGDDEVSKMAANVDYVLKVSGLSTTGGFYVGLADGSLEAIGFHAQLGYLIAEVVQPVVRVARVMPDDDAAADAQEIAFGAAVYFAEHDWKWQTDVTALTMDGPGVSTTDWMVRTQVQANF